MMPSSMPDMNSNRLIIDDAMFCAVYLAFARKGLASLRLLNHAIHVVAVHLKGGASGQTVHQNE